MTRRSVLVAGAGGAVGFEIVRALRVRNCNVTATYRTGRNGLEDRLRALGATPAQWDIADADRGRALLQEVDAAVFSPILTVSEKAAALSPDKPMVFFSSNNVDIDPHAPVYEELRAAEERVSAAAPMASILRPTMIYGHAGDGNLSALMRVARRWPLLPMIGNGRAMQQPVFYRDVAAIAADCVEGGGGGVTAVAGPTVLTQRDLYDEICAAAAARCVILPVPVSLAGVAVGIGRRLGLRTPLTRAQIDRSNRDRTPAHANLRIGDTSLKAGLRELAGALDDSAAGA